MYLTNFFSEKKTFKISDAQKKRRLIKTLCQKEKKKLVFINCVFCSDKYLLDINRKYLNHDYYTDVITFDHKDDDENIEGDIYISIDRVEENALKHQTDKSSELTRVIIHGILLLIGYKDKTKKDKEIMTQKENKYLSLYYKI